MKRRTMATVLIGSVLASALAGWVASATIRSPAEVAARTKAPAASTILVPVERRVLASSIVTRGTARFGAPQQLMLAQSALKSGPGVVSQVAAPGTELREGGIALVGSGRPVFVVTGTVPAFRDLGPGLAGDDVRQLQRALIRMGFLRGSVSGVYDGATERAVARWYRQEGFAPFRTTADQLAEIRGREADLLTARLDVLATDDGLALAGSDAATARAALDEARRVATRAPAELAQARAWARDTEGAADAEVRASAAILDAVRTGAPGTPAEVAAAQADLDTARADEVDVRQTGASAVQDAADEVARLVTGSADARASLADAIAVGQADVAVARAALDAVLADPGSTPAQVAAARAELARVQARAASDERQARADVGTADRAEQVGRTDLESATTHAASDDQAARSRTAAAQAAVDALTGGRGGTPAEVAAAASDLAASRSAAVTAHQEAARRVAEARAAEATAGAALAPARAALAEAESSRTNAADALSIDQSAARLASSNLGTAQRKAGVQLPADEMVVVAGAPVRVSEALAAPGAPGEGPVLSVTDSSVTVDGSLALDEASLVEPGMSVQLDEPALNVAATGRVSFVAPTPGTYGVDGFHVHVEVSVDGDPPTLPGVSLRMTVPVTSSQGEVLAVPVGALALAPDGSSQLQVDHDGALAPLTVVPGLVADGYVAVESPDGSLAPGDQVAVGTSVAAGG